MTSARRVAPTAVTLPTWANGPTGTGNGGFAAGVVAALLAPGLGEAVTVTLRTPPPLGRPLTVRVEPGEGGAALLDAGVVVADAVRAELDRFVPDVLREIDPERAAAASTAFGFRDRHPFPTCLVCGAQRAAGEPALNLHCGTISGYSLTGGVQVYADAWHVDPALVERTATDGPCAELGLPAERLLAWAALDCPSAAPFAAPDVASPVVLGRITVRIDRVPLAGETLIAGAWSRGVDGRRRHSSSVLIAPGGELVGVADATWFTLRT